jgi:hypothetical protein
MKRRKKEEKGTWKLEVEDIYFFDRGVTLAPSRELQKFGQLTSTHF